MKKLLAAAALLVAGAVQAKPPKLPDFQALKFDPPKGVRVALPNGMLLYMLENHELPVIQASAMIRTGSAYDPPNKIGVAGLLGAALRAGGSEAASSQEMNRRLEFLGASVESGMGRESGSASMWTLSKDFDEVFAMFADMLRRPAFEKDKVELERQKTLEGIRRRNDDPRQIARREARRMLYGPDHPYGRRLEAKEVEALTIADLRAFHKRYVHPADISIAVAGDFDAEAMVKKMRARFGDWKAGEKASPVAPWDAPANKAAIYLAPRNITQATVRLVQFGFPRHHPDHFAYEVMNDILGGNPFISRLFAEVRSRKGLAYYAGSFFSEPAVTGMIGAVSGTKNQSVAATIDEILAQINRIRSKPVTEAELDLAVESAANSFVFNFQTPFQIIHQRMALDYYGYPPDYLDTYIDKIRGVTREDVQAAARKWLQPDKMILYVVGDPKAFDAPLDKYGKVVEVKKAAL